MTGLPYDRAADLLNGVAEHVLHADAPRAGEVVPLRGGPVIEIVEVAEPCVHLSVAAAINGPGFTALQPSVYADDHGHWPWDANAHFRGVGAAASRSSAHGRPSAGGVGERGGVISRLGSGAMGGVAGPHGRGGKQSGRGERTTGKPDESGVGSAAWARCTGSAGRTRGGSPCARSC